MLTCDKIVEIFFNVDDFCKEFEIEIVKHQLDAGNYKVRNRKASLADGEIIPLSWRRYAAVAMRVAYSCRLHNGYKVLFFKLS